MKQPTHATNKKTSSKREKNRAILFVFAIVFPIVSILTVSILFFIFHINAPLLIQERTIGAKTVKSKEPLPPRPVPKEADKKAAVQAPKNAVVNSSLYVDPNSSAAIALKSAANPEQVRKLSVLATTPTGMWQTAGSNIAVFSANMAAARSTGKAPIVVLYAIPNIGCGSGGTASVAAYRSWVAQRAALIQGTGAIVVLEPDSVAQFSCLNADQLNVRKQSLNAAIEELAKTNARVYVDAGHAAWIGAAEMAARLNTLNMASTKGISVNVSNFQTNDRSKSYAASVLAGLSSPGLRAVVDSSRNGAGPPTNNQWCNPLGRKVGTSSIMRQDSVVDGYLWIKIPGESDGSGAACNNGTAEGTFWLDYALSLVD